MKYSNVFVAVSQWMSFIIYAFSSLCEAAGLWHQILGGI